MTTDKKAAIFNTTLKLLVERGFYATPMSEVAKQSGVSVGIIYHYFESKEDLIHQLYADIKTRFALALNENQPYLLEGSAMLKQIWFNAYHYCETHSLEVLFLEQYENSPYFTHSPENIPAELNPLLEKIEQGCRNGLYLDLPLLAFYDMTIKVAMSLAKRKIAGELVLDQTTLERIADAIYRSILQRT